MCNCPLLSIWVVSVCLSSDHFRETPYSRKVHLRTAYEHASKNNPAKVFAWNMRISSILILFLCNSSVTFLQSRIDEAQHNFDDSVEPVDTCAAVFGDQEISVCQAVSGHSRFTVILSSCFYLLQKIFFVRSQGANKCSLSTFHI